MIAAPLLLVLSLVRPTPIAAAARMLRDPSARLTIAQVSQIPPSVFRRATRVPPLRDTFTPRITWLRVRVRRGSSQGAWALQSTYLVTRIDLFVPTARGYLHRRGGFDLANRDQSLVPGLLELPERALDGRPFYVRVSAVVDPRTVHLVPIAQALPVPLQRRLYYGLFIGFYLTIAIFNALMFLSLRDPSLLDYAAFVTLQALDLAISFGTFWQVLPPLTFLQRELVFDGVAMLSVLALSAFTLRFLKLATRDRIARNLVIAGTIAAFLTVAVDFLHDSTAAYRITLAANLLYYGALIATGIRSLRARYPAASYFTAAACCFIAGYAVNMSASVFPEPALAVFAVQGGSVAGSLLLALALAKQVQTTELLATRDGLTGVLNRRSFDEALEAAVRRAYGGRTNLGVLLIDIDRFKALNDAYGHLEGDACLRRVAEACARCVRAGDVFARYGGEEFGAIAPGATLSDLEAIAGRMVAAVTALAIPNGSGALLTISIGGTASAPSSAGDAQRVVAYADANLYRAKLDGRNRAVLA